MRSFLKYIHVFLVFLIIRPFRLLFRRLSALITTGISPSQIHRISGMIKFKIKMGKQFGIHVSQFINVIMLASSSLCFYLNVALRIITQGSIVCDISVHKEFIFHGILIIFYWCYFVILCWVCYFVTITSNRFSRRGHGFPSALLEMFNWTQSDVIPPAVPDIKSAFKWFLNVNVKNIQIKSSTLLKM